MTSASFGTPRVQHANRNETFLRELMNEHFGAVRRTGGHREAGATGVGVCPLRYPMH